jgi:hypothetical protein
VRTIVGAGIASVSPIGLQMSKPADSSPTSVRAEPDILGG